jgi:hypothetical protein
MMIGVEARHCPASALAFVGAGIHPAEGGAG